MKRTTIAFLIAIPAVLAFLGLTVKILYDLPDEEKAVQSSTISSSSPLPAVRVSLLTNKREVDANDLLELRVRIRNESKQVVTGLSLTGADEPGFFGQSFDVHNLTLKPGTSYETGPVNLHPSTRKGRYRLTIGYQLIDASLQNHAGQIVSEVLEIRDPAALRSQLFWKRVVAVSKDLTLPLVVAILGILFQWSQSRRDETARDRAGAESRREEIWKTILPQFYRLSEQHYLPLVRSLRSVHRHRIKEPQKATSDQVRRLLFEFLFLLFRMDLLRRKRGQIFFKSRKGEQLASSAWRVLILGSERALGRSLIDATNAQMSVKATYQWFCDEQAKGPAGSPFKEVAVAFDAWLGEQILPQAFYAYTDLAEIMRGVLYFESNRPFDHDWYGECATFDLAEAGDYTFPSGLECDNDVADTKIALTAYNMEVRAYLREAEVKFKERLYPS